MFSWTPPPEMFPVGLDETENPTPLGSLPFSKRDRQQSKELAHWEDLGSIETHNGDGALLGEQEEEVCIVLPFCCCHLDLKCCLKALFPIQKVQRWSLLQVIRPDHRILTSSMGCSSQIYG